MELSNEDLLNSAMTSEEPVEQEEATQVAETEQQEAGQTRDEQGRFAAREEQAAQQQVEPTQQKEAFVPSGRLREEREAREAAERRYQEAEARWQRELQAVQARLPQQEKPKAPDVFEDPNGFLKHGVGEAVDPIKSEMSQLREFYSRKEATREHGAEKVKAAYDWIAEGMRMNDPARSSIYQRAMQSMDPYGEIVSEHLKSSVFTQIGNDPQAWFGKTLEERLSDPKFAAEIMQKIQGSVQQNQGNQAEPIFTMPPNLRRAPGSRSGASESTDMSNAALMAAAQR